MPTKSLEAVDILEALESKLAYVPGGRDREGRPLIVVNVPSELQPTTKPRLEVLIAYFLSIFSEETKKNGLVLIVDARKGAWRVARSCIRLSMMLLGALAASVIVVRPDGFWDKRVDSCTKSHKEGEPTYLTLSRLQFHVDFAQLPYELGGNRQYDHTDWIQKRVKAENYIKDATDLVARMIDLHQRLTSLDGFRMSESDDDLESYWGMSNELIYLARQVLQSGRNLVSSTSRESTKDALDTSKRIHELMDSIELKQLGIENSWSEMERNLDIARVIGDLEKGVSRVTDWILGPADAMLNSCCQVGFDVSSSEELRRRHEELELECRETYGRYAELLHKIDSLPSTRLSEDLKSQRDFMDFVCRSFANRLERRRNVLITSQRFFRLVSEYFDKTSEVFDKLVMGNRTHDFSQAGANLLKLEQSQAVLESLERELVKEGEKLSDILSMPVKDALGRDVHVDYGEDIVNVRDILDATNARKNIFNDSVELQKLSLKQIALVYTYESDAEQAVKWLNDLYDVLLKNHMEIGCNALEIQSQKEEHQTFQETAKGTYDYGCQLANGARVLRLSCRLPLEGNASLFSRLRQAWKQLRSVGQEQLTRLRVCAVFHRSVEDHCSKLRDLIETVASLRRSLRPEDVAAEARAKAEIRDILGNREKLLLEVGRMVRLGRLLRTRLREPLYHQRMSEAEDASGKGSNLTAVEAISARLAEVTRLAEKLDARLCEAGARTRPVPMSSSAMSSTSSLFSSSNAPSAAQNQPSSTGTSGSIPATASSVAITVPLISSSVSTVQLQPKCMSTILSSTTVASESVASSREPTMSGSVAASDTVCTGTAGVKAGSSASGSTAGSAKAEEKTGKLEAGEMEGRKDSGLDGVALGDEKSKEDVAEDIMEKSLDESLAEDSNVEGYVTATECSITPTARSRSASFVTSPEWEELAAPITMITTDTWSNIEEPKFTTTGATLSSSAIKQVETSKESKTEEDASLNAAKPEVYETSGEKQIEKVVSMEKRLEEKSGKIVKEVTETTTLRVSHDTRLGVASYKVISNTLQDHRENVDVKEMKDLERIVAPDVHEKTNGLCHEMDSGSKSESYSRRDELSTKTDDTERVIKFAKVCEINQEIRAIPADTSKDIALSLKEYTRHHEDSGIEMSPTKKEENLEGQDFLERARKNSVSRMVDGPDSMETMENSDGLGENESRAVMESNEDPPQQTNGPATTTISTIAVQSGGTRLVIALLQSGERLELKVLEVKPELTRLGATVKEATELSNAHDEVLLQLQSKQSPVEELLRQADQLISNQRPRAEVYAAMAETLGQAWRDVNELLERRKQILDRNVLFQRQAEECRESMRALEMACNDTLLPIEIEAVKNFLSKIHDLRKNMLEALMGALQEGKNLLDRLKEIANEGTLDSRPDRIKMDAEHAVLMVEKWLEELHDRRQLIEASFRSRKTQLEQCLALALLATDLRDLEESLNDRIAALSSNSDQLGDSASSAELLLYEVKKLKAEAKEFQDRSIKITKSTERLVSSGHFAGEQATEQAYAILGAAADYVNDLDQYESLLVRAVAFFNSARSAITTLDQLKIQLLTTEHPPYSMRLARLHAQTVATIEDATTDVLAEGQALLDVTGRGAPGAEGVKRVVEELEDYKIRLLERCTAHEKENLEISRIINAFLDKHDELRKWLMSIPEALLQGHQDMGSDAPMAEDFCQLHRQLLNDLERRREDVERLEFEIHPIKGRLEEAQNLELRSKVEELQNSWTKTESLVANRIDLSSLYLQFHLVVEEFTREIESIENELKKHIDVLNERYIEEIGRRWKDLQPLYAKLTGAGKAFLDAAAKIDDPYLDVPRARKCVQTLLEKFANRQLTVTESWEKWLTTIEILKERRIEHERKIEESTRTMEWVSKFSEQLYPVITSQSNQTTSILQDLAASKSRILPELNKAVNELDSRVKGINTLAQKGEVQIEEEILNRLHQMHENLRATAKDYETLLDSLISTFQSVKEVEHKIEQLKTQAEHVTTLKKSLEVEAAFGELDAIKWSISDRLSQIKLKAQDTIARIRHQEPPEAGVQDIEKLKRAIESLTTNFEVVWSQTTTKVEEYRRTCTFAEDLERIDGELRGLNEHLKHVDAKVGENLQTAKATAGTFVQFERTVTILEERIETFIKTTEESITVLTPQIVNDISSLRERWRNLKKRIEETKKRMSLSIEYFTLLEEALEWNREGNKLLVIITRKTTACTTPEDTMNLLQDIENYLKPGEELQERRIEKLKQLSTIVFGTERLPQFNEVIVENRQMLDSFAIVSSELRTLAQNLKNLREKIRIEKQEAEMKLQAAKQEMAAAEAARLEAENARKVAEQLAAETLEKAATEARRLREEREVQKASVKPSFSVSAQTEKIESTDESVVHETVTSAVTTKEIHILQKTEIEKTVPVEREPSPPKKIVTEEIQEKLIERLQKEDVSPLAPQFTIPLNDATVQEGEKFTFQCDLVGRPVPEIVWYKDGISILNNPDYFTTYVNGICTLTIEETFAEDSARYTCRAFNIAGSAETSATLTVKETAPEEQPSPPVFVKELTPSVAMEGSSYQLDCIVEGNPLPTVQWFKNDVNIDNSPDYIITYNNGKAVLKFEEVFLEDKATYSCKAANRLGQASTSASLDVEQFTSEKPFFVTPLSNAMGRAGQRVRLECEARGNPMPTMTWYRDGKPIEETMNLKIQTEAGRSSLTITEAFAKDAGCYMVVAKNDAGEATVSCNVSVKGRLPHETSDSEFAGSDMEPVVPKIQMPLKDLKAQEGRSVRLDCVIIGQPEPEVIWYHDDQPVKESADFQLLFQGDKCSLVIHEAFLDDAGVYKVVAINSGGEASSQCTLTVLPVSLSEKLEKPRTEAEAGSPPKFVKLPTDSLVAEGETAIFECAVVGEPRPELRWFSDSGEIIENERILIQRKEDGTSILRISSTIPEDKGIYVVKASNTHGEAKAFARLIVRSLGDFRRKEEFVQMEEKLIAPTFKERFEDRSVPEGVSTKFECIVVGKPAPKIQWLFNDRPVHGKDFLVSVSGDRQVLTIPETGSTHVGTISCVAENAAGKAICSARLEIGGWPGKEGQKLERAVGEERVLELVERLPADEMHAASSSDKHFSSEKTEGGAGGESQVLTKMSQTITESSTTHTTTKKEYISSTMSSTLSKSGQEPTSVCVKSTVHSTEQSSSADGAPPVVQSYKVEEHEKIIQDQPGEIRQEKTVVVSQDEEGIKRDVRPTQISKPSRKSTAPRFVSPITGMIVDQGTDIVLEGIIDGFPQPSIVWSKNGQELKTKDGMTITYAHNHVRLELKNVNVKDAGRYTCSASNEVGSASSTADLVVKKTIFPPVFGRRLQAQVVKRGDRVNMEVEVTGTPEPTVTWFKDDVPIKERPPQLRIKQQGNCYMLIIDKAEKEHTGKYMVRATNAGGEAQSIADFAVFEPTPDTMVEVHKTVTYENVHDKKSIQSDEKKAEVPSIKQQTSERVTTKTIEPIPPLKTTPLVTSTSTAQTTKIVEKIEEPETKMSRSETISSTLESHQMQSKSEQKFHMKLEHKTPSVVEPLREEKTVVKEVRREETKSAEPRAALFEEKTKIENENIETSTIAKKDALSFFESMTKETETTPKGPKEMIKLVDDVDGHEVKVGKLTKNYERSTTYQEVKKPEPKPPELQTTKKAVHEIFTKLEQGSTASRGVDNKLFDFPYEPYKPPPIETKKTVVEETISSGSSSVSKMESKIESKMESKSESSEVLMQGFTLVPEPPPEIGYMPKPEEVKKKRPEVSIKAKQLQESFEKTLSPIDAPVGGVKIFPTPSPKVTERPRTAPAFSMPPPPFELDKKEIIEEPCVKKEAYEKKDYVSSIRATSPSRPWSSSSDFETRSHVSTDLSEYRCHSAASSHQEILRVSSPRPSADGLAMEKSWAKKCAESTRKSWPPQEETRSKHEWQTPGEDYKTSTREFKKEVKETPEGGIKKTSMESSSTTERRSWSSKQESMEKLSKRAPSPPKTQPIIYKAETTKVDHTVNKIEEKSMYEKFMSECDVKKSEKSEKIEEYSSKKWSGSDELKAPGLVRNVEPPKKPVVQLYHLAEPSPATDQIILEPGPPPEIGYIPPVPVVREKKIEKLEKHLEVSLEHKPAKIPPGGIRTIPSPPRKEEPPALPPKDVKMTPPPIPAKQPIPVEPPIEPFPFKPSPTPTAKVQKVPPPPTPTKFVKGSFAQESDYESDMDSHVKAKWRPYESDGEEPRYRRVQPPVPKQPRPRSTEPEPLPPSKFEVPPTTTGPPRPVITKEQQEKMYKKTTTYKRQEKETKQQRYQPVATPQIELKPGSPPIYVQPAAKSPTPKSPPVKKPESPKFKVKTFQQESGYMADTDEPFQQKTQSMQKSKHESMTSHTESRSSYSESRSEFFESKSYESRQQQQKKESTAPSVVKQPTVQRTSFVEKSYASTASPSRFASTKETIYATDQSQKKLETTKKILPPSPSPSKFVKGEFRESDYESDYDGRIPPLWKPRGYESDDQSFRAVKPSLAGPGKPRTPLIETKEFPRKEEKTVTTPTKPKTVLLPGSPPEIAYAPPQPTYYEARSGVPFHNAIGTETKKTVRMDESTENSRRIVTVEQTSRVIKFGDQKPSSDYTGFDASSSQRQRSSYRVPTPKKFVQGQFRESDYESDIDTRIKPKWAPADSDTEEPRYRKVQPPQLKAPRSSSAPVRHEHVVSPLEFDTGPPVIKRQTSMTQLYRDDSRGRKSDTQVKLQKEYGSREPLKPGSPPEFGFISRSDVRKAANHVASRHMTDMTSSFKSKTERFVSDIQSDLKQGKPILKHPADSRASDGDEPRTYREESRHSEHGTKQIDPDTGLIYFKYDFGYEFGIVLPGEGKKTVSSSNRTIQGQRRASDIEVPIVHEFTTRKENGFAKRSSSTASSTRQSKPASKFGASKTVKWEPTSESEFSEAEDARNARKRRPDGGTTMTAPSLVIPCSPSPSRWDHTTPSPLSLSPSLPSLSPRYSSATGPPSNVDSAGSPWPTTNGVTSSKEVIQPYLETLPKKAPLFITPLRDIAVVSGQTARFECIVQAEPQPNILWSKDGRIIENSSSYEIHYRNGVCRLTVVRAFPEDAGTYACTATNSLGSTVTSATLQVPGNIRSVYAPIS